MAKNVQRRQISESPIYQTWFHSWWLYDEYEGHLVAENFKKYLIAKCPNLKNALQMETKEVHGIGYIDYCFESK